MIISIFETFLSPGRRNPVFSGRPVFQKVHIWNLHVMEKFWMLKISLTKLVWDRVLPGNCHFQPFFKFVIHAYPKQLETKFFMSLTFPGCRSPVFQKVHIWNLWNLHVMVIYGSKNFPGQILSGIQFCPEAVIFYYLFSFLIAMDFYSLFRLVS